MNIIPQNNPRIPEGINSSPDNPLKEFFVLLLGIGTGIVGVVIALSMLARVLAPFIPFEWEAPLSSSVMTLLDEVGSASQLPDREQAMKELGQKLLVASTQVTLDEEITVPIEAVSFHLVDADMPNAFATLAGHIVVTEQIIDEIDSENGLAMIIAHEIAHIQLRHPIESASRGLVIQLALAAVLGSANGNLPGGFLASTSTLTMLGFNRDMELAADTLALLIVRQQYGHLGGADEFFETMTKAGDTAQWLEFTQTHPSAKHRLQLIRDAMELDGAAVTLTPLPKSFIAN